MERKLARLKAVLLPILGGGVSGLVVVWTTTAVQTKKPDAPVVERPADRGRNPAEARSLDELRSSLAAMREEHRRSEAARVRAPEPAAPEPDEVPGRVDVAAEKAKTKDAWENRLAAFAREPVDPSWASGVSAELATDVNALQQEGHDFSVVGTECKSKSCTATLQFPSYAGAVNDFGTLLNHQYSIRCARQITMPEPSEHARESVYEATILFDCTDVRAGEG